ncbi:hypothetical protein TUM4438_00710 [Shewanella sairae]|uniref:Uncharacterized protein n=1 Tax=Shewanella sairae TaxID=190310 RepID=A0ABQ4NYU2_9GAMM|nr:hypothetical protein [Shewanella sairae]MCL1131031.1 hypothetical protein [Shewanella sairae]GIU40163.1 hypothetical protein TUM4438_00710 [Shewanella sairae]
MSKQLAYLAFLVALVSQFILSPAMAMPKYLSASSHPLIQQDTVTPLPQQLTSINQSDNHQDCVPQAVQLSQLKIDCDAVCEQLAAGNCVSHCASAPGIVDHSQLAISIQSSSNSIQANFWSLQTVELSSKNPPPIYA